MRYLEEIALKQVIEEYQNGTPLKEISKKFHLPIQIIKSELLEHGEEKGKEILLKELERKYPMIKEMIKECKQEKTIKQLSEQYHLNQDNIRDAIKQYQTITGETIVTRNKRGSGNVRDDLKINEIIDGYKKGKTFDTLANEQESSVTAVRNRVNKYIQEHGNEIVKEHNKANEAKKEELHKIKLPIEEIVEKRKQGKYYSEIAKDYGVSATTIQSRIKDYEKQTGKKIINIKKIGRHKIKLPMEEIVEKHKQGKTYVEIAKDYGITAQTIRRRMKEYEIQKNTKVENHKIQIIDLSMIVNYLKLGYSFDKVQKFAKENGYKINESDTKTAQKIQKGELKVATEASIEKIVEKYGYSYEELTQIAEKKGYVVLEDRYVSAKANINNKNKKGEER